MPWEYSSKLALKKACLEEAGWHFTQASSTPFLMEPLVSIFDETGSKSEAFDEVLSETFQFLKQCNAYTHKVIVSLQQPSTVHPITLPTVMEYSNAWHCAHESTSSSPSKIHFGHYMAANDGELGAYLLVIPLKTGTTPRQWCQSINIILEKVAGLYQVDKLCIIHLFEADFNANNKWFGWAIMTQAEAQQLLANAIWKPKTEISNCAVS